VDVITGIRGWLAAPIIVLSGRIGAADKVAALDAGADDYVTKPFGMDELMARMRAVARRANVDPGAAQPSVSIGKNTVDLTSRRVSTTDGRDVRLTKTEWELLERIVRHPGQLVTQRQLLAEVWGPAFVNESGYLRFHFGQLRRKLEADPGRPRHLVTEPGIGYRFVE
jgi:two-component system KDP operon response regulator KdpE